MAAPVRALAVHPAHGAFLYCGTEVGLFASEDGGATWSPTNQGPANCSVDDLFFMTRAATDVLIRVTHGRRDVPHRGLNGTTAVLRTAGGPACGERRCGLAQ
ncbi:hypothetical protein ABT095_01275 [Kitasatospora sp. NPDC002227]|uniref:hypothetical protein n=1 Tax=Kitasatospora sp. NPDC002227 TaxID=3154773 RepID=UPI0033246240